MNNGLGFCGNTTCDTLLYSQSSELECPSCGMIGEAIQSIGDAIPAIFHKEQILRVGTL